MIVGFERDVHSLALKDMLQSKGEESLIVDFSDFPSRMEIGFAQVNGCIKTVLTYKDRKINFDNVRSIFFRRPKEPNVEFVEDPEVREYIMRESDLFLDSLPNITKCHWVSRPDAIRVSSRKPYQLVAALGAGLDIPSSVIGNSVVCLRNFMITLGSCKSLASKPVNRPLSRISENGTATTFFTQKLKAEEIHPGIDRVKACPLIFQEYVEKDFELRITVVRGEVFACAIYSQANEKTRVDWRHYDIPNTPHKQYELPLNVKEKCIKLVEALGLEFGCIDMIVTPDGRFVFLEINPIGQWLWIEELTKMPITESLADLLLDQDS
ncbi:MAG: hypothetical protein WD898_03415 [Candidatus Paceibacterota bacterium]